MLINERLEAILTLVNQQHFTTFAELAAQISVSEMTLRRDVDRLAVLGKVRKVRGGIQRLGQQDSELSVSQKETINVPAKRQIAQRASRLITDGDTLYFGTGTTIALMSDYLTQSDLRIITNSLTVFWAVTKFHPHFEVTLIGGQLRQTSGVFIGGITEDTLQRVHFDKAFVSADGVADNQLMNVITAEGRTQKAALEHASERYALADKSKIDHAAFYTFFALSEMDQLITNSLDSKTQSKYQNWTQVVEIND